MMYSCLFGTLAVIFTLTSFVNSSVTKKPNIVFVLADDLGYYDVSWTDKRIISPNLETLRNESLILENYYVHSKCTPSRAAILTGYYDFRLMTQHEVIVPFEPRYIPFDVEMFQQRLQTLGYRTVAIGKWHQGYCRWETVPTRRGFDEFFGVYLGAGHHFKHTKGVDGDVGHDFRENETDITSEDGVYSTDSFTNRAVKTIQEHDQSRPLYLYLPYLSVHTPLQVPTSYIKQNRPNFPDKTDKKRTIKAAMVTSLDEGIGKVVQALKDNNMWDNTIFIFSSDNGAPVTSAGYNHPYRGNKGTLYEGGCKTHGFIRGGRITPGKFTGLFHAVDWFDTLLGAILDQDASVTLCSNDKFECTKTKDSINQWESLVSKTNTRNEMVYGIDETIGSGAIRDERYKLMIGNQPMYDSYYEHFDNLTKVNTTKLSQALYRMAFPHLSFGTLLYDLKNDPYEKNDLSESQPEKVEELYEKLKCHEQTLIEAFTPELRPLRASPQQFNGIWSPGWCNDIDLTTEGNLYYRSSARKAQHSGIFVSTIFIFYFLLMNCF